MNTPYSLSSFSAPQSVVSDDGQAFVIVSSNESEHAEWDEGSEWGDFLTNTLIPALHEFSVETYNELEEFLDEDFVADYETDEVE